VYFIACKKTQRFMSMAISDVIPCLNMKPLEGLHSCILHGREYRHGARHEQGDERKREGQGRRRYR